MKRENDKDRKRKEKRKRKVCPLGGIAPKKKQILAADWDKLIRTGQRITIRQFAAMHGLKPETWRGEYHRGASKQATAVLSRGNANKRRTK